MMNFKLFYMAKKLYDSFKQCVVTTHVDVFTQVFTNDWSYGDIESWMLDTYCIEPGSIVSIEISSIKRYKYGKD